MGISPDAHLVYGWKIEPEQLPEEAYDDLYSYFEEKLEGTGLGYLIAGGYDWAESERPLVLTVNEAPSWTTGEDSKQLPPDAFDFEAGLQLDARLRGEARERLGIQLEG